MKGSSKSVLYDEVTIESRISVNFVTEDEKTTKIITKKQGKYKHATR